MLLELVAFTLLGIIAGTFTGLTPGIHINLVAAILVSLSISLLFSIPPIYLITLIVAMSITHTFLDFIPSIFLGCPDTDTELSLLPGHKMLIQGRGYEAILLTAYGSISAIILTAVIAFPMIILVPKIYLLLTKIIPLLLISISLFMILSEKNKLSSTLVYSITGFLGVIILNPENILGISLKLKEPLLPLLTGLFGSSSIILSIKNKTKIPKQHLEESSFNIKEIKKPLLGSLIASPICGFLPGLGSGQAAILGNTISKTDEKGFLVLLGATNTLVMIFSFISLYTISKIRTGSAAAIDSLIGTFPLKILILIIIIILLSGIIAFFLTKKLSIIFSKNFSKINYTKLSMITLFTLLLIVFIVSGLLGVLTLIISTITGIYCITSKVRRTGMMACLLLPTILLYII